MSKIRQEHRRSAQQKHRKSVTLNLVSLMDIFTILVFFLMVNSSEVEVLQTSSKIKLPDSTSETRPDNRLVISVSEDDLVVQGRAVATVKAASDPSLSIIPGLRQELEYQASRKRELPEGGLEITIMGDRELPYWLLKKVMLTCQQTDFAKISLAVNRLAVEGSGAESALPQVSGPAELAVAGGAS